MIAGGAAASSLARDTVFAAVMIILNGIIGLCLLVGGIMHREQVFSLDGVSAALVALASKMCIRDRGWGPEYNNVDCPNNGKRHPSSRLGGSREKRMTKTLKFLGAALLATLAAACGTSTKTSTGSSSITPGTLALDPPFRIASLNAAALGAELGASAAGAELLLSLIHI